MIESSKMNRKWMRRLTSSMGCIIWWSSSYSKASPASQSPLSTNNPSSTYKPSTLPPLPPPSPPNPNSSTHPQSFTYCTPNWTNSNTSRTSVKPFLGTWLSSMRCWLQKSMRLRSCPWGMPSRRRGFLRGWWKGQRWMNIWKVWGRWPWWRRGWVRWRGGWAWSLIKRSLRMIGWRRPLLNLNNYPLSTTCWKTPQLKQTLKHLTYPTSPFSSSRSPQTNPHNKFQNKCAYNSNKNPSARYALPLGSSPE